MNFIKIIFFSLLALSLVVCTGIFIFFQTFDTDQYLPQITKKASFALGRQVSIGHLGLGFDSWGITLDAGPVLIQDDPDFTTQPFIKVDRVRVSLDLKSLVFRREIHVAGVLLQSPEIHFIRNQEGRFNTQSIGQTSKPAGDETAVIARSEVQRSAVTNQSLNSKEIAASPLVPLNDRIIVSNIRIQDASVSFIDQSQSLPLDIWLNGINASLNGFSLSKPFQLSFDASLYSNVPNVHVSTLINLSFPNVAVRNPEISDLRLNVDFFRLDYDRLKGISPQLRDNSILRNIAGSVQLNLASLGTDASGGLETNGNISIADGVIKNFNIIKVILSRTLGVFGVDNIDNLLKGQLKDKLGADDTAIEKAQAAFSFHDKTAFIDDSLVRTNIFELTAKGTIDQGLNIDMQTMLHLNEDVSAALVSELDGLKYLMDDSKRMAIGASLKGVVPHLKYKPNKDFRKKSRKALMQEGGNILGILLGGQGR